MLVDLARIPGIAKGHNGLRGARHFKHAGWRRWTKVLTSGDVGEGAATRNAVLRTYSGGENEPSVGSDPTCHSGVMSFFGARNLAVLLCAAFIAGSGVSAQAQGSNPDQKPPEQQKSQAGGDAAKAQADKKRSDEIAEASRQMTGPAANPECIWLGWRVVRLLWRDDLDTAFRHLDLYDRFGCPGNHIQASFRCLVRQGPTDSKSPEALDKAVKDCWINPAASPDPAAAAAPAAPPAQGGTSTR